MKRISLLLLPVLLLTALAPFAPFTSAAEAVTGAAFTTVNTSVDGTGHCLNGNPRINCNIYNGKEYVWLNGGPKQNKLGPSGQYFFAVLSPGGQPNANDGSAKNLSDNFDAYTNRTFTVTNGKVSAYSGTHTFDHLMIRLFPYDSTRNPGGVYILAICSLGKGYPVKASACKFDQFKVMRAVPTNTPTPTACVPAPVKANFNNVPVGSSVQAPNAVAQDLTITARNQAIHIAQGSNPVVYRSNPNNSTINGGIDVSMGGFGDYVTHLDAVAPEYTFEFSQPITDFQLRMLDFGDFNPKPVATNGVLIHKVTLQGYTKTGVPISGVTQTLEFNSSPTDIYNSPEYGNLLLSGDALAVPPVEPGNYMWHVTGQNISKVVLTFSDNFDPNVGFDLLSYTDSTCP